MARGGGGGIRKRGPTRTDRDRDRDGDMDMDQTGARGGKQNRGTNARSRGRGGRAPPRAPTGGRPQIRDLAMIERAISMKESQVNLRTGKNTANPLEEISISGWKESTAAKNRDGGVSNLVSFIERKMIANARSGTRPKVTKSRVEGDTLVVSVRPEWASYVTNLNGAQFAGTIITVEPYDSSSNVALTRELGVTGELSAATEDTKTKLSAILSKRYYSDTKLLNLSSLAADPDLLAMGIFNSITTQSKFFPALMKVWSQGFEDPTARREAVVSVSLAGNQLENLTVVTSLAATIPGLKNLDMSNNKIKDSSSFNSWRWKFRNLEFLDLTGNPWCSDEGFKNTLMKWYPTLQTLNNVQVRTAEEIAALKKTPIPVQVPFFQDEADIVANFIGPFFSGFDNNRTELVNRLYDDRSIFSFNINVAAPKAPEAETPAWDPYIKKSRNLLKINHLPAQMSRSHTGKDKICEIWNSLPPTRHPDSAVNANQYLVECNPIPGLADPTGQSPTGVGGLLVMVHGKFEESVGGKVESRSFDRTFVLGPAVDGSIRVINDALCLRAYGGSDAWVPETPQAITQAIVPPAITAAPTVTPSAPIIPAAPSGLPVGYGAPAPGKTDAELQKEQLIAQLSAKSNMTLQYTEMALSSNGWDLQAAWTNFENLKAQGALPADAFRAAAEL
ncbi:nuclear mRNA export poly(A)+RNA binding protein [Penicillium malachiteum]|uniref:nuclear mRNA export poly(A)+RNA binding protein n=1 Tax=Penicillium malachiteum TaxID=1324776 RepID=UPI00254691A2|nr:nuclear mRNA export poly(A)+RNA binding protein [Penicillium malachiteum]KAJ5735011.1 nuclear mRNA export poly(A)+RNA binding protein [Penicillium malachiteum]